jgi:RHS repeat-associated protein
LTYNAVGLPLSITDPLGRTTRITYDTVGNPTEITRPDGQTLRLIYDAMDQVVQIVDGLNRTTAYTYDAAGRLLSVTDPAGGITAYSYDAHGRLSQHTSPDGRITTHTYRADNRLAEVTRSDQSRKTYEYDAAGRLTSINIDGSTTHYRYSPRGELEEAQNATGRVRRIYDAAGQMTQEEINGQTVDLTYDEEGRRIQLTALDIATGYTYDPSGRLNSIHKTGEQYSFAYDTLGRRTGLNLPNGAAVNYAYDTANQLTGITHSGGFNAAYGYGYDAAGRIVQWSGDGPAHRQYGYDAIGRLTSAADGTTSQTYEYDALGNRQGHARQYDSANRLTEDGDHRYTYDPRGNLTAKQHKTTGARSIYTWNSQNQLIQVDRYADAEATTPSKRLSFTYGPLGRRWSKTEDGLKENYVYDGHDLIAVLDEHNHPLSTITFGPGIDQPLDMTVGTTSYYYHTNHQGSVTALTDGAATLAAQYSYSPYGVTQTTNEIPENPFHFTGREFDADDLYYYRARYYDPTLGRFISEDPIGPSGGDFNLYGYVQNNPVNLIDPLGLETVVIIMSGNFNPHAAVRVDNGSDPVLYDPAGSYNFGYMRPSGDQFWGQQSDLDRYINYHLKDGSDITLYRFNTTPKQESIIANRIENQEGVMGGFCAQATSGVIDGVGPFDDLGGYWLPSSLGKKLSKLPEVNIDKVHKRTQKKK